MPSWPTARCPPTSSRKNARPMLGSRGVELVVRFEHPAQRGRSEHRAVRVGAAAKQRRGVAGHVAGGGTDPGGAGGHGLAVLDRLEPAGAQLVAGREPGPHPLGPDEVGVVHAQLAEQALAEVAVEGDPLTSSTIWARVVNPWLLYANLVPGSTSTRRPPL
jgi:hypothetical protein